MAHLILECDRSINLFVPATKPSTHTLSLSVSVSMSVRVSSSFFVDFAQKLLHCVYGGGAETRSGVCIPKNYKN